MKKVTCAAYCEKIGLNKVSKHDKKKDIESGEKNMYPGLPDKFYDKNYACLYCLKSGKKCNH